MHLHILGVCGTFMGGIAALARAAGHTRYTSGPQWLAEHVLHGRHVIAVAGTHGKTTTTAMIAWLLECVGDAPGFLIGGVPRDFEFSARLGSGSCFVVEADEYDTAFFDKRSKFVHYRARTLVLNNLEFDHADIFPDLASIERQFHHLVRTVSGNGLIISNDADANLSRVLAQGCWTPVETFGSGGTWTAALIHEDGSAFTIHRDGRAIGEVRWAHAGMHMVDNALAAVAAAVHAGVPPAQAVAALCEFGGVRRRMELRGTVGGVSVWDDFAHHPTAIATTLDGLRRKVGAARIIAVVDPRSSSMRAGVHADALAGALQIADKVVLHAPASFAWDAGAALAPLGTRASTAPDPDAIVARLVGELRDGDHVLVMSNGAFGGLHDKLLSALERPA
ncbi:MAG: UDP-N-acetylmuramate:L-alanyl-gamma-D-glutamyl-meso-diaminopimelate ligase [Xanthomonadaceae bacterium]|nr:UDP-N-acetylmuramate:L-alanyl-gamma-D-glutamyl-meso-diaminopimelate ligase [Xanthomonadaceae bacterium]